MRVIDISSSIFLGNLNYIKFHLEKKNENEKKKDDQIILQDVINVIYHLSKDVKTPIISFLTTLNNNLYCDRILPLNVIDNNFDLKIIE